MQNLDIHKFQEPLGVSKAILLVLPQNPDFDMVAAATSLALSLKEGSKDSTVACPTPMIVEFNQLVGVNKVTDNLDNRNLIISFKDYDASGVEKVSYNIEDGNFTLVVVPKPGVVAPTREQLEISFRGTSADIVLVVGALNKQSLGRFADNEDIWGANTKVAVVGNHPAQGFLGAAELVNPQASCVCEAAFGIIESLGLPVNSDISTNLFAGLRAGTDNFQKNITAETFAVAARLLRAGASLTPVSRKEQKPLMPPTEWLEQPRVFKGNTLP